MKGKEHRVFKDEIEIGKFTVRQIAELLNTSTTYIYNAFKKGKYGFMVDGSYYYIEDLTVHKEKGDKYAEEWERQEKEKKEKKKDRTNLVVVKKVKQGDVGWVRRKIPNKCKPAMNGWLS